MQDANIRIATPVKHLMHSLDGDPRGDGDTQRSIAAAHQSHCNSAAVAGKSNARVYEQLERLGVHPDAWAGWETIHVDPLKAIAGGCYATVVSFTMSWALALASQPLRLDHHIPLLIQVVFQLLWTAAIFRWGPSVAKTKLYYAIALTSVGLSLAAALRLLFGPLDLIPFNNRLAFACVYGVNVWHIVFGAQLGFWEPDHPPEPYRYCFRSTRGMMQRTAVHICCDLLSRHPA